MKSLLRFTLLFFVSTSLLFSQCPPGSDSDTDGDGVQDCIDPCTALANSIIGNTSFESDFIGWTIPLNAGNFTINTDASNTLDGSNALYITAPNDTQFENYAIYSEEFTLEEGVGYSFRIPAKRIGNTDGDALRWALVDENGVYRHLNNYYNWTTDWTTISFDNFQADFTNFTSNRFRLRLEFGLSTTDMVVDKIEFYETSQGYDPAYQDLDNDGNPDCVDPADAIPDNDSVLDATEITSFNYADSQIRLDLAEVTSDTPVGCNINGFAGAFYKFTATENTYVSARISDFDPANSIINSFVIAYTATDLNATSASDLTHLPESACVFGTESIFQIVSGQSYYIMIHRSDATTLTNFELNTIPAVPQSERDALTAFYNSTNGANWTTNTNWNSNLPVSSWFGITTTNINGQEHVTSIDLNTNNVTGSLPTEIGDFSELEQLALVQNGISGNLPNELGNLLKLKNLYLGFNNLEGNIPSALSNAVALEDLRLSGNPFNGEIPTTFGNLSNLSILEINSTNLSGSVPIELASLPNLTDVFLSQNNLAGNLGDFSASSSLTTFIIQDNQFTFFDLATHINANTSLPNFVYSPQNVGDPYNVSVSMGETVTLSAVLNLGSNTTYNWYKSSTNTFIGTGETIDITINSGADIDDYYYIVTSTDLPNLTLESQPITVFLNPAEHPDFEALELLYNSTSGWSWLNNDNWLNTNEPISTWHGITEENGRVTRIDLNNNQLIGSLPDEIGNIEFLDYLDIRGNFISGNLPNTIGNLQNVTWLDFRFNQLSGSIPASIATIPNLYVFVVSNNNLSGTIPDFTGLTNGSLDFFYIDNNQFVFADFENEFNTYFTNLSTNFIYSPQQFIDVTRGVSGTIGETVTLEPLPNLGSNLTIDWYDATTFGYLGTGATFDVTINSENDYGEFFYFVNSGTVSGLGLQSRNITVGPPPSSHPDYDALLAVFNALDGPNWNLPWNVDGPIETWDAASIFDEIVFDGTTNRVSSLTLNGPDKSGNIPTEIGDLSELTYLNIGSINITGSIPSSIGNLSNLTELWLTSNDLSGEVPNEIWNLTNLVNLLIGIQANNQLTLNNGIPASIANLQDLEWLNLSGIPLSQPLQPELFNLPSLIRLRVQGCGLSGQLPGGFANISDIYADNNDFSGTIPTEILNVTDNNRLSITNNLFDFSDLEPLAMSNGYTFLTYSPQRTLDVEESVESGVGVDITLNVNDTNIDRNAVITATNNQYQWFKDDVAISGANGTSYTIVNAQEDDSGIYFCRITNPLLPELVIDRAPITLFIDSALNVEDIENNSFSLYPNPANNWIHINGKFSSEDLHLNIYNMNGRMILKQQLKSNMSSINIETLEKGVYLMEISDSTIRQTQRFIKH